MVGAAPTDAQRPRRVLAIAAAARARRQSQPSYREGERRQRSERYAPFGDKSGAPCSLRDAPIALDCRRGASRQEEQHRAPRGSHEPRGGRAPHSRHPSPDLFPGDTTTSERYAHLRPGAFTDRELGMLDVDLSSGEAPVLQLPTRRYHDGDLGHGLGTEMNDSAEEVG